MVYGGKKVRQIERESLTGLCHEDTLTPILGCPLMRCPSSPLALAPSFRLCLWVLWVSFWCQGIVLDRSGDRQLVGVSLAPLHSLATAERLTASAMVRSVRFYAFVHRNDRFRNRFTLAFLHNKIVPLSDNSGSLEISRFR